MDCPKCGTANLDKATQCGQCEAELPKTTRVRGWLFQHPLLVTISGVVVTGLFSVLVAVINKSSSSEDVALIPVDQMQEAAFDPAAHDPNTPKRNLTPAFPGKPDLPNRNTDGSRKGLYGRTGDGVSCDVDALLGYLTDPTHTSQANAWAGAAHIRREDIPAYFKALTPVRLRFDSRVTNYDYKDGKADGYQAVLQAGTSVLVDDHGVPRAKCNCGNPLMEPSGSKSDSDDVEDFARNPEDAWDGFKPQEVVTVTKGERVSEFVLLDLDDGEVFKRGVGSNGSADTAVGPGDPACETLGESTSCGGPGPQATPEDVAQLEKTLKQLTKAVEDSDCRALVDVMSAAIVAEFNLNSAENMASCQEFFRSMSSMGGVTINDMEVVSQTGAQAVVSVTVTLNGESYTQQNNFVRENGSWKVGL